MKRDPRLVLDRIMDFLAEDILEMTDEQILAESDPDDIERARDIVNRALASARQPKATP